MPETPTVLGQLEALRLLDKGWDGYRAESINPRIIDTAIRYARSVLFGPTSPRVVPMSDGRLQFEWSQGNRELEMEFETPETIHYLKCNRGWESEEEDRFDASDHARARALIAWFFAEPAHAR